MRGYRKEFENASHSLPRATKKPASGCGAARIMQLVRLFTPKRCRRGGYEPIHPLAGGHGGKSGGRLANDKNRRLMRAQFRGAGLSAIDRHHPCEE